MSDMRLISPACIYPLLCSTGRWQLRLVIDRNTTEVKSREIKPCWVEDLSVLLVHIVWLLDCVSVRRILCVKPFKVVIKVNMKSKFTPFALYLLLAVLRMFHLYLLFWRTKYFRIFHQNVWTYICFSLWMSCLTLATHVTLSFFNDF